MTELTTPSNAASFDVTRYQDPLTIQRVVHNARTIAIVGLSKSELRASYFVGYYLKRHGYRIIPVNPRETEILGEKSYKSLLDVPGPVDIVNVFRAPDALPAIAADAVKIHAGSLWCQFSVINEENGRPWPPLSVVWPTGKLLVAENQISCDTVDQPRGFAVSSVFLASLDDVGFLDNQSEVESQQFAFIVDVFAAAGSVRVNDNRLSETWLRTIWSAASFGLMNITAHNESTHCMRATGVQRVFRDNLHFVTMFCPDICGRNN